MPNPLPADDFRSVRIVLEDEDFALPPKNPNHLPRDLIERNVWNSIVILPDDVSVRTSNEYGQLLKGMDRCWDAWIESLAMRKDPIESAILDTADEFHAGTYNSLHGLLSPSLRLPAERIGGHDCCDFLSGNKSKRPVQAA